MIVLLGLTAGCTREAEERAGKSRPAGEERPEHQVVYPPATAGEDEKPRLSAESLALARELQALGVYVDLDSTFGDEPAWPCALVGGGYEEDVNKVLPALSDAGVRWGDSIATGLSSLWVDVRHFHRARSILLEEKKRLNLEGLAVWQPGEPEVAPADVTPSRNGNATEHERE
jgi:hypothetical protein